MADDVAIGADSPEMRAELEAHLEDALHRARTQLSHIRGNLALVATFLTRAEH